MPKIIVDIECGEKECGVCDRNYGGFCAHFAIRLDNLRLPACLAGEKQLADLVEAIRGLLTMMDRGPKPHKFDEALTWRENDELVRSKAKAALAPFEEKP